MEDKIIKEFDKKFPLPEGSCHSCEVALGCCEFCEKDHKDLRNFLRTALQQQRKEYEKVIQIMSNDTFLDMVMEENNFKQDLIERIEKMKYNNTQIRFSYYDEALDDIIKIIQEK